MKVSILRTLTVLVAVASYGSVATAQSEAYIDGEIRKVVQTEVVRAIELAHTLGSYPKPIQVAALDLAKTPSLIPVLLHTAQVSSIGDGMALTEPQESSVLALQNYLDVLSIMSKDIGATALLGEAYDRNEVVIAQVIQRLSMEPANEPESEATTKPVASSSPPITTATPSTVIIQKPDEVAQVGDAWALEVKADASAAEELIAARGAFVASHPRTALGFSVSGTTVHIFRAPSYEFADFIVLHQRSYPSLYNALLRHWGRWVKYYDAWYPRTRYPRYWSHRPKAIAAWKVRPKPAAPVSRSSGKKRPGPQVKRIGGKPRRKK